MKTNSAVFSTIRRRVGTCALRLAPLLAVTACAVACSQEDTAKSNESGTGGTIAGTGATSTGATSTGATNAGGSASGVGGSIAGGSGGTASGGAATGGDGSGGVATGGVATGGAATGGTGGATGGTATGGTASGGTASGGTASGGTASGGTGGTADPSCSAGVWDNTTPKVLTLSGNKGTHDPTMIEENGVFYRFWTGDNIPVAKSTNLTNWTNAPSVYNGGYPAWVDQWLAGVSGETFNFPWAPDASHFNGQYHLYSAFSAKFGDNISCITHLTTNSVAGGNWTDHGPVICTKGNENYNAIDPDIGFDGDGTPWMAFGSFWDGIELVKLKADGTRADNQMTRIAWASQIEAPVLFYRCGYYYLFVTWGLCCPGAGRTIDQLTYRVAVGRSTSIQGPYVDKTGQSLVQGGGTLLVQGDGATWAAAGHSDVIQTGNKIYHLYHAYRKSDGGAELRIVELPFDKDGWPVAGGP